MSQRFPAGETVSDVKKDKLYKALAKIRNAGHPSTITRCIETLLKVTENLNKSDDAKFKKLPSRNKKVKEGILDVAGGAEFLGHVGFRRRVVSFIFHNSSALQFN